MRGVARTYLVFGESKTLIEWTKDIRCLVKNPATLRHRFWRNEMSPEECLTTPFTKDVFLPEDYIGKIVNSVLICRAYRQGKKYFADCKCRKCNKDFTADLHSILRGHQQTCGCLRNQANKNHKQWRGYGEISLSQFSSIKKGAAARSVKTRRIEFNITIQEVWELFLRHNRRCALSGVELKFARNSKSYDGTASLDRINPSKGYVIDNVQWIHKDLNFMKSDFSQAEFKDWCRIVTEYDNSPIKQGAHD